MSITVESLVSVEKIDGELVPTRMYVDEPERTRILVHSCSDADRVCLEAGGTLYAVNVQDLLAAIANAQNTGSR